jgi:hypothetical protein
MSSSNNINCQVTTAFNAPKRNGGSVIYKKFKIGDRVKGNLLNDGNSIKMFQTVEGFLIPKSHLNPLRDTPKNSNFNEEVEYAEIIEDKKNKTYLTPSMKANMTNVLQNKSKTAINGAVVGLVLGLAYAMAKGKSKMIFSVVGSISGFIVGNMYNNYVNEDQNDNTSSI